VDLVGPLPASKGFTYLFTIIDRTSRWPEAVDCANALFQGWVSRFGVPAVITSDRGAQFTSSLWAALCRLLNIQHNQTTAYHPQSNGMVERFHRCLKDALHARCAAANWVDHLPWVLLGLRAAAREDDGSTPAQEVFKFQV
jgi:transposase InsO family protein